MHSFPSCGLPLIEHDQKDVEEYLLLGVTWEVDQGGHPHPPLNDPQVTCSEDVVVHAGASFAMSLAMDCVLDW